MRALLRPLTIAAAILLAACGPEADREARGVSYVGYTDPMDDSRSGFAYTAADEGNAELAWRCTEEGDLAVTLLSQVPIGPIVRDSVSAQFRFDSLPAWEPERFRANQERVFLLDRGKVDSFTAAAMRSERVLVEVSNWLWLFRLASLEAALDSLPCRS